MIKVLGSRKWTFVGIGIVVLLLIGLVAYGAHYFFKIDTTRNQSIFIEGEYSVDGGEWKPIDAEKPINDTFHKIVFKGKMNEASTLLYANMTVWKTRRIRMIRCCKRMFLIRIIRSGPCRISAFPIRRVTGRALYSPLR